MRPCPRLVACVVLFTSCTSLTRAADSEDVNGFDFDFDTDDLIDSIKGALDTLFDYVGDEDGCFYKCSNGKFC